MPPLMPATKKILTWTCAIFALQVILSFNGAAKGPIEYYLMLNPGTWWTAPPFLPFWQPITYGFLHSTQGLTHLAFNMLGVFFFGNMLEGIVGTRRMVYTYFGAMLAGALLHLLISWVGGAPIPVLGASGAVLGIIAAAATLRPDAPVIFLIFPMTLKTMALLIVGIDLFAILANLRDGVTDGVAHWVHLGGALFGFVYAYKGWIWVDLAEKLSDKREAREVQSKADDERRMDRLLAQIKEQGLASLSNKDRAFLKKMSERKRP